MTRENVVEVFASTEPLYNYQQGLATNESYPTIDPVYENAGIKYRYKYNYYETIHPDAGAGYGLGADKRPYGIINSGTEITRTHRYRKVRLNKNIFRHTRTLHFNALGTDVPPNAKQVDNGENIYIDVNADPDLSLDDIARNLEWNQDSGRWMLPADFVPFEYFITKDDKIYRNADISDKEVVPADNDTIDLDNGMLSVTQSAGSHVEVGVLTGATGLFQGTGEDDEYNADDVTRIKNGLASTTDLATKIKTTF